MMAFRLSKRERCGMCGTAPWEWDPAQGGSKYAYEPTLHECPGCKAKEIMQQDDSAKGPGQTVILTPTRTVAWAKSMVKRQRLERARRRDRG